MCEEYLKKEREKRKQNGGTMLRKQSRKQVHERKENMERKKTDIRSRDRRKIWTEEKQGEGKQGEEKQEREIQE